MAICNIGNSTIVVEVPAAPLKAEPTGADARIVSSTLKKIIRVSAGVGLVVLGIIGLVLPIMPGWVFLIPGLLILSDHFPGVKRLVDWAKKKARQHPDA